MLPYYLYKFRILTRNTDLVLDMEVHNVHWKKPVTIKLRSTYITIGGKPSCISSTISSKSIFNPLIAHQKYEIVCCCMPMKPDSYFTGMTYSEII
jgi:hypothetical protein